MLRTKNYCVITRKQVTATIKMSKIASTLQIFGSISKHKISPAKKSTRVSL